MRARLRQMLFDAQTYYAEIKKCRQLTRRPIDPFGLALDFSAWRKSLCSGTPIEDERAWLTFRAIRRVASVLSPGSRVFEYGAGGSTLYFLRAHASVITVDHDARWIEQVAEAVRKRQYEGWTPLVRPPTPSAKALNADPRDPNGYVSSADEFRGLSFETYACAIDGFEDEAFDVVLVDGRARPSCGKHAQPKVRAGGYLVLDNSERDIYEAVHRDLVKRGWASEHFYGPGPYNRSFWQTSVYQRPMQ